MYKSLVKPLLFNFDAERVYHLVFDNLRQLQEKKPLIALLQQVQARNQARAAPAAPQNSARPPTALPRF